MRKIGLILGYCAVVCGIGLELGYAYMAYDFANTRPHLPDPQNGRIYRFNNHGAIGYLTEGENSVIHWMWNGGLALFVIGGLTLRWTKSK